MGGRVIPCRRGMVAVPAPASPPRMWRESRRAINNQGTASFVHKASLRLSQSIPVQTRLMPPVVQKAAPKQTRPSVCRVFRR